MSPPHEWNLRPPRWLVAMLFAFVLVVFACDTKSSKDPPSSVADDVARVFTLEAKMTGYVGVGGTIDGQRNPVLEVEAGEKVAIVIINEDNMAHDVALASDPAAKTQTLLKRGETASLTFTAKADDTYFCSIPGHRQAGMVGKIAVRGSDPKAVAATGPDATKASGSLEPARPVTVEEIGWDAREIPPPIARDHAATVEYTIETKEVVAKLEDGTTFELWTYDGKIPGPMLRAREGDTVVVHVSNAPDSVMAHSIDFHSVTGPGGGAAVLQVPPGERRSLRFKAMKAGIYVYHCATPHIPTHIARGMFGMILIEPKNGMRRVDREFYVMQGEYYTAARPGTKGHQSEDSDRLLDERPSYVVMNGRVGSLTGARSLTAEVGETVRIYFGVGGPNGASSFHLIGEIFDRVYREGAIVDEPSRNVQTTLVPPGGATVVELKVDYPGKYLLVDHALSRVDKGAVAILDVTGPADPSIFASIEP